MHLRSASTPHTCEYCGYVGKPLRSARWLAWLAAAVWLVPLAFLLQGFWPFFLLPAIAITAWAVLAARRVCPHCGKPWTG